VPISWPRVALRAINDYSQIVLRSGQRGEIRRGGFVPAEGMLKRRCWIFRFDSFHEQAWVRSVQVGLRVLVEWVRSVLVADGASG